MASFQVVLLIVVVVAVEILVVWGVLKCYEKEDEEADV